MNNTFSGSGTLSLRASSDELQSDGQSRFMQERITNLERRFGDLCTEFVGYVRRTTKLRDNGDEIARILSTYGTEEQLNRTTGVALCNFAEHMSAAEDYRNVQAERLVVKVVTPLASYGDECKRIKINIKNAFNARKRERAQLKKVNRSSSGDAARMAQNDLAVASLEVSKAQNDLNNEIMDFEKKKLERTKQMLTDFVQIEMMWHAKALEMYSQAFNDLTTMDSPLDLEEFTTALHNHQTLLTAGGSKSSTLGGTRGGGINARLSRHDHAGSHNSLNTSTTINGTGSGSRPPPRPASANLNASGRSGGGTNLVKSASLPTRGGEHTVTVGESYTDDSEEYETDTEYDETTGRSASHRRS